MRRTTPCTPRSILLAAALLAGLPGAARLEAQPSPRAAQQASRKVVSQAHGAIAPARDTSVREAVRDSTELQAIGRRYARTVRHCYQEQGLKGDPTLRGLLLVELTVLPTGIVHAATATASDVAGDGMPAVAACVSAIARSWRFSDGAPVNERVVLEFDLLPPSP